MTTNKTTDDGGVTFTVLATGMMVPFNDYENRAGIRGEVINLTAEQVEGTKNRYGQSWLYQSDEDQLARWSIVKFRLGDHSEGITYADDDPHGVRLRLWQAATKYAQAISDPAERRAALQKVAEDFPEQRAQSQWTLRTWE